MPSQFQDILPESLVSQGPQAAINILALDRSTPTCISADSSLSSEHISHQTSHTDYTSS